MRNQYWMIVIIFCFPADLCWSETASDCLNRNSQSENVSDILSHIAIFGKDDRQNRVQGDLSDVIEASQGRIWCAKARTKPLPAGSLPTKEALREGYVAANASLVFDADIALVNRHVFKKKDGRDEKSLENCYFEHIESNSIVAFIDVQFKAYYPDGNDVTYSRGDYALVKLASAPAKGKAIPAKDILINEDLNSDEEMTVVSNYSAGASGAQKERLTIVRCSGEDPYGNSGGRVIPTFCDTGKGASAGQVFVKRNSGHKLIGLISGHTDFGPNDPRTRTAVTLFEDSLVQSYQALRNRHSL